VLLRSPSFTLPTLIAIISTVIAVAVPPNSSTAAIVTLFLGPLPIGSIFIAATISPRAPYLMGGLAAVTGTIGLIVYALWAINISGETGIGPAPTDILYAVVFYGLAGVVVGGVIGLIRLPFRWLYWNLRNGGRRGG
jgi:hypothetical protein